LAQKVWRATIDGVAPAIANAVYDAVKVESKIYRLLRKGVARIEK
jgi:LPS sulfotransferase NodH